MAKKIRFKFDSNQEHQSIAVDSVVDLYLKKLKRQMITDIYRNILCVLSILSPELTLQRDD